jgi:trehalose 6-phosphate phosphatase
VSSTIDPRRHDAVLFCIDADPAALVAQLAGVGVRGVELPSTENSDSAALTEAVDRLHTLPGRCVLITDSAAAVKFARAGGFALIVGLNPAEGGDDLRCCGADDIVRGLGEITVRTGDQRMSQLPDATEALLGSADGVLGDRQPAVFFDFDGTLSDIVDDPDMAALTAGAAEALQSLTTQCPVAVLSGRDLADVRRRIALPGIWYAGSHGFEAVGLDGEHHQNDAAASAIPVLEDAAAELREQLGTITGVAVEDKRFGVAVHYRNAERDRVGEVLAAVRGIGQRAALRVTTGREVIELRPDIDWDKGKTLRWVVDQISDDQSARLLPIYLGDDITDEDAFDAVLGDGIGIVVRHSDDGDRATAARYALNSPAQVSDFAGRLARRIAANR